jgi:hypothetical protein
MHNVALKLAERGPMLFEPDNIQELIYDYYVGHCWGQEVLVKVITQENPA